MVQASHYTVVLETPEGQRRFECGADEFIWNAAARNGIILPSICHQGRCLTCAGYLLSGEVDQSQANFYRPEDREAGFVLLCRPNHSARCTSALICNGKCGSTGCAWGFPRLTRERDGRRPPALRPRLPSRAYEFAVRR